MNHILAHIFSNCSPNSIYTCTLICKLWNAVSTKYLYQNPAFSTPYGFKKLFKQRNKNHKYIQTLTCTSDRILDKRNLMILSKANLRISFLDLSSVIFLSETSLMTLISKTGYSLQHVNLSGILSVTDLVVGMLVFFSNSLNLLHLNLSNCKKLSNISIHNIKHIISLKHLDLNGCFKITDTRVLVDSLPRLEYLGILGIKVKQVDFKESINSLHYSPAKLQNYSKLTALSIGKASIITASNATAFFAGLKLREISLVGLDLPRDLLLECIPYLSNCIKITLKNSSIDDLVVESLLKSSRLVDLNISHCRRVTKVGGGLKRLDIGYTGCNVGAVKAIIMNESLEWCCCSGLRIRGWIAAYIGGGLEYPNVEDDLIVLEKDRLEELRKALSE